LHSASCLDPELHPRLDNFLIRFRHNPTLPGRGMLKVSEVFDPGMWIAMLALDIGVIIHHRVHQGDNYFTLLFVATREEAELWARSHHIEPHPSTGTHQLIPISCPTLEHAGPPLFAELVEVDFSAYPPTFLMALGIPPEWVGAVQAIRTDEDL